MNYFKIFLKQIDLMQEILRLEKIIDEKDLKIKELLDIKNFQAKRLKNCHSSKELIYGSKK